MARIKNVDVLGGKLFPSILRFGIPLLLVALIQTLFNAVDIMVLSQMADNNAVASVGATSTIVSLIVNLSLGISMGAKIVLARLIGEGVREKTQQTVFTTIVTAIILGVITMVVGITIAPLFLRLTNCPSEIYDGALLYLQIYFAAAPAIMLYNFGSNLIRVSGDSQRPLYYMVASGLLNIVLNYILCLVMTEKVAAVAIATAASQVLGAVLVLRRTLVMDNDCRLCIRGSKWNWRSFYKIMANGLPIGFSSSLYSIANLQIQTALNSFGPDAIAGNAAAVNIEAITGSIANTPWTATASVFIGQNVGADNKKRVKQSILVCGAIALSLSLIIGAVTIFFSAPLLSLFVDTEAAVRYGQTRMLYIVIPYAIAAYNGLLGNAIQAFGYSIFSTLNSIFSVFVFRMIWMRNIYPLCPTFHVLMQCFLVSWLITGVLNTIFFFYLYYGKFKKNKIKKMG